MTGARPGEALTGPAMKRPFPHRWGKPYADGYATCPCGARENTREAAQPCPQWIEEEFP